ncbi:serine hydrolase [Chamaesiphon minutus]|uniref:Beta-lactamase class A n=1 Tax=Chamaesiphon minutus (strain ATCC 27169 / PCC 6605) TaxID=1173020 RepID=K9UP01_CHAP6|nr:serine hydrolase [Chamaesiphon minutus]AFY96398.1 beta-lactamase class A [Chamaesiphon minutus PCC 6605]
MASNSSADRRSPPKSRQQNRSRSHSQRQQVQQLNSPQERECRQSVSIFIHLVRLSICGLGASTIAGTTISILNPPQQAAKIEPHVLPPTLPQIEDIKITHIIPALDRRLQATLNRSDKIDPSYLFVDLNSGEYTQLGADRVLPAASTIKLPILIALFQDVDAQKVQLEEKLTIDKNSIAGGSGDLQAQKPGTQVSILVAATKMMTISDNTATNLIINRLGGATKLNQRFRNWGLKVTTINRPLPDLEGKNTTTPRELARTMMAIDPPTRSPHGGKLLSDSSTSQILSIMSNTIGNTMLPKGLGAGAKIAHKTGDIGSTIADVGAIELPSGKKYLAAVIAKRPYNDPDGPALVRSMSKIVYEQFSRPLPTATPNPQADAGFPKTVFIRTRE